MRKTEECKAIITIGDKKYETCHLRMGNLNLTNDSFYLDEGIMWFCFDTVDEYNIFYDDVRSRSFSSDEKAEKIITNIEFCFFDTHRLMPRKEGKNGIYLLQDNIQIENNKIVFSITFNGQGRFYFE